jgi:hypothetical protein
MGALAVAVKSRRVVLARAPAPRCCADCRDG